MSSPPSAMEEAGFACENPRCARPWPIHLRFCPYCGAEHSGEKPAPGAHRVPSPEGAPRPPAAPDAGTAARTLRAGENAPAEAASLTVALDWRQPQTGVEVDASAYVLGPGGRVRQDEDMIFYGQESFAGGALRLVEKTASSARFCLDVAALPEGVEKIVFCGSIDPADGTVDFTALAPARIEVTPEDAGQSRLVFEPEVSTAHLAALIFGEVYRRAGAWRFRAVGQGFAGGLGALARSYGVDIAD